MKNILITGGSGFFGKHFVDVFSKNYNVVNLGMNSQADVVCSLDKEVPEFSTHFDCVVHCAGKAHIYPKNTQEVQAFFDVNHKGTKNLIKALEKNKPSYFVYISSVSVYGLTSGENIDETTPLEGDTAYALSKIYAEKEIEKFCKENNINYLILRLPLLVGKNPPGNLGKMIEGIKSGKYARIAKGRAQKSMVRACDVVNLVEDWVQKENPVSGIYNLTDGVHPTFFQLEEHIAKQYNTHVRRISYQLAIWIGQLGDYLPFLPINSKTIDKITCTYTFSDEKARKELDWNPKPVLDFDL